MKNLPLFVSALVATLGTAAFAYTITGTVGNEAGNPLSGVTVTLVKENKATVTDIYGQYTINEETGPAALRAVASAPSFVSLNSGVLSYRQSGSSPVQVRTFDAMGNQVFSKTLYGSGELDLRTGIRAKGNYFAKVTMGSARQDFRFFADGKTVRQHSSAGVALMKDAQAGETLRFEAEGYETRIVPLGTLDTMVNLNLERASGEQTYAFGYAMGNAPRKSRGCGKTPVLEGTEWYQCQKKTGENTWPSADVDCSAQLFSIYVNNEKRFFYVTFPGNYDKNKPYKLLFANHCMGSEAKKMATWVSADRDHLSPYYAQKAQDTEGNYIFVAPEGNTDGWPWSSTDKDHRFFSDMLTYLEDNYCIDTTRVFATGFSFGAMFTNSLAWEFQSRIRAVAVYATAIFNIYLPKDGVDRSHAPIAWMGVHGKQDGMCPYLTNERGPGARDGALIEILKNNSAAGKKAEEEVPEEFNGWGNGHVCYDFKDVDPRFPVKWCSHNGDHHWSVTDDGDHTHSWVPQMVHEFFEQF